MESNDSLSNFQITLNGTNDDYVLYNFYQATGLIDNNVSIEGSLLAPYAASPARSGGHINGTLIANNFSGRSAGAASFSVQRQFAVSDSGTRDLGDVSGRYRTCRGGTQANHAKLTWLLYRFRNQQMSLFSDIQRRGLAQLFGNPGCFVDMTAKEVARLLALQEIPDCGAAGVP